MDSIYLKIAKIGSGMNLKIAKIGSGMHLKIGQIGPGIHLDKLANGHGNALSVFILIQTGSSILSGHYNIWSQYRDKYEYVSNRTISSSLELIDTVFYKILS